MSASTTSKISFVLAAIDLWLATICAIAGDAHFIVFMLLSGLMYAHGLYWKTKAKEQE